MDIKICDTCGNADTLTTVTAMSTESGVGTNLLGLMGDQCTICLPLVLGCNWAALADRANARPAALSISWPAQAPVPTPPAPAPAPATTT